MYKPDGKSLSNDVSQVLPEEGTFRTTNEVCWNGESYSKSSKKGEYFKTRGIATRTNTNTKAKHVVTLKSKLRVLCCTTLENFMVVVAFSFRL